MKQGKLTLKELDNLINSFKSKNVSTSKVGDDVAYLKNGEKLIVLTCDPISATEKSIGNLAVDINMNDLFSAGSNPIGIMVTLILPTNYDYSSVEKIMSDIDNKCLEYDISILGGHTEFSDAVNRPIVNICAVGSTDRIINDIEVGCDIVITKSLGLEGTVIFFDELECIRKKLSSSEIKEIDSYRNLLSIKDEANIAKKYRILKMHDITEGGFIGAMHELFNNREFGALLYKNLPISDLTFKVCNIVGADPNRLISSGSLIIFVDKKDTSQLIEELKKSGINATLVGEVVNEKGIHFIDASELIYQSGDSLYEGLKENCNSDI